MDKRRDLNIDGHFCHLVCHGDFDENTPVIYYGMMHHEDRPDETKALMELLAEEESFFLAAFEANDWNHDFSPWRQKAAFGERNFTGGGPAMLSWLKESLIPYVEEGREHKRFLMGYSLAGLFALYGFYEGGCFYGAASASGSLWFEGFEEFVKNHPMSRPSIVYLSLGSRESKTKNPVLAEIGDLTQAQYERLKKDPMIMKTRFEMNSGGHFSNVPARMAKAVRWLLMNSRGE